MLCQALYWWTSQAKRWLHFIYIGVCRPRIHGFLRHPCCQYPVLRASNTMVCCLPVFTKASVHSTSAKPMSCASLHSLLHMALEFIAVLPAGREETYVHAGNSICVWDEGWRDGCDQDRASRPRYRQLSPLRCKTMLYSIYTLSSLIPLQLTLLWVQTVCCVRAGMQVLE